MRILIIFYTLILISCSDEPNKESGTFERSDRFKQYDQHNADKIKNNNQQPKNQTTSQTT